MTPAAELTTLNDIVLKAVLDAIDQTGSKTAAARQLGIARIRVYRMIAQGFSDGRKFEIVRQAKSTSNPQLRVLWPEEEPK